MIFNVPLSKQCSVANVFLYLVVCSCVRYLRATSPKGSAIGRDDVLVGLKISWEFIQHHDPHFSSILRAVVKLVN